VGEYFVALKATTLEAGGSCWFDNQQIAPKRNPARHKIDTIFGAPLVGQEECALGEEKGEASTNSVDRDSRGEKGSPARYNYTNVPWSGALEGNFIPYPSAGKHTIFEQERNSRNNEVCLVVSE
jgi:hypothetical protein